MKIWTWIEIDSTTIGLFRDEVTEEGPAKGRVVAEVIFDRDEVITDKDRAVAQFIVDACNAKEGHQS